MDPKILELSISTPQPRVNEPFDLKLDDSALKETIFSSVSENVEPTSEFHYVKGKRLKRVLVGYKQHLTKRMISSQRGTFEVGPLSFQLNGTNYTTNKVCYEVVDALPDTDTGFWLRKVDLTEGSFCLITEQRMPAMVTVTKEGKNKGRTTVSSAPANPPFVIFKNQHLIGGLRCKDGHSSTGSRQLVINGEEKTVMHSYAAHYFDIVDRESNVKITKEDFENIPDDYEFEDILIG